MRCRNLLGIASTITKRKTFQPTCYQLIDDCTLSGALVGKCRAIHSMLIGSRATSGDRGSLGVSIHSVRPSGSVTSLQYVRTGASSAALSTACLSPKPNPC